MSIDAVQRLVRSTPPPPPADARPSEPNSSPTRAAAHRAMPLLHAGVDTAVIALWLGHEGIGSTNIYLHADMTIKQRALELTAQVSTPPGRYRPKDAVLAFLEGL